MMRSLIAAAGPVMRGAASLAGLVGPNSLSQLLETRANRLDTTSWRAHLHLPPLVAGKITHRAERLPFYRDRSWIPAAHDCIDRVFAASLEMLCDETEREQFRFMDLRFFAADQTLNWTHWSARAHGLSIRSPYNDMEILEFVHRLPMDQPGKPELRRLGTTLMPHDMAYSPKLAHNVPLAEWIRGPMREFVCDNLATSKVDASGIFVANQVEKLLSQHMRRTADYSWRLWTIMSVLVWQDVVLARHQNRIRNPG